MAARKKQESLHSQVSDLIRDKIYGNEWPPGSKIPTEFELMDMLGVSRGTVQKALDTLANEGLIEQIQGKGTFVRKPELQYATGGRFLSFAESLRTQGIEFETDVLKQAVVPASQPVSERLQVALGSDVLKLHRLRHTEKEAIVYQESFVNLTVCPGLEKVDFSMNALFDSMESASKRRIGYSKAQYAARIAGKKRGGLLGVGADAPILNMTMIVFLESNIPVEWVSIWIPSSRYVLSSVMQRL
jgi:GntR family transcriptional regulator